MTARKNQIFLQAKEEGEEEEEEEAEAEAKVEVVVIYLISKATIAIVLAILKHIYLDSSCSNHMTSNKDNFVMLDDSLQSEVKIGDDKQLQVKGKCDILVQTKKGVKRINNVFYVPGLKHNLLSVGQLLQKGHNVIFKDDLCEIRGKDGCLIAKIETTQNKMFPLNFSYSQCSCFSTIVIIPSWLWHLRYRHLRFNSLSHMCQNHMVRGLANISQKNHQPCEACILGEHHRNQFPVGKAWRASNPLELVHTDLCGPMRITSIGGFDRGGEFVALKSFLKEKGIRHQQTVHYTPQQNGVAERKNRTIIELTWSMLKAKGMPNEFWGDAATCSVFLLKRATTISVQNEKRGKLDDKSEKCILVGYSRNSKSYRLYNPTSKKVIINSVYFNEEESWKWNDADQKQKSISVDIEDNKNEQVAEPDEVEPLSS
ncbi:hypothetical protein LWI28_028968 [Acer negundo]|uniref:Integrase catalytic domain-containing protein n=1 Tax=Acer negundo TaxID=4023 RepID=A0AAD5NUE2_ACENE|nr:hypothetical protein LWI28_028968 [Acer negundo]